MHQHGEGQLSEQMVHMDSTYVDVSLAKDEEDLSWQWSQRAVHHMLPFSTKQV